MGRALRCLGVWRSSTGTCRGWGLSALLLLLLRWYGSGGGGDKHCYFSYRRRGRCLFMVCRHVCYSQESVGAEGATEGLGAVKKHLETLKQYFRTAHSLTPTHTHMHTQTNTDTHAYTHTYIHRHSFTHAHTHTGMQACDLMYTRICIGITLMCGCCCRKIPSSHTQAMEAQAHVEHIREKTQMDRAARKEV